MGKKLKRVEIASLAAFHRLTSNGLLRLQNSLQSRFQWVVDPGGIQDALGADGGQRHRNGRSLPQDIRSATGVLDDP
jgi:hypothetical protein